MVSVPELMISAKPELLELAVELEEELLEPPRLPAL
jgi:hypothetical protein